MLIQVDRTYTTGKFVDQEQTEKKHEAHKKDDFLIRSPGLCNEDRLFGMIFFASLLVLGAFGE